MKLLDTSCRRMHPYPMLPVYKTWNPSRLVLPWRCALVDRRCPSRFSSRTQDIPFQIFRSFTQYVPTYLPACLHTYIHAYMHTCIHTHIHTCMHACMRTYVHTCIRTYIHTYIHKYVRTYTHTHILHITCLFACLPACLHSLIGTGTVFSPNTSVFSPSLLFHKCSVRIYHRRYITLAADSVVE